MADFASTKDLTEKEIHFEELGPGLYGFTAEGDPNTGVVIGDDSVLVVDAQATPVLAQRVIEKIRTVTDKPIRHVVLSHYHAVRVLGASAFEGAEVIASRVTDDLITERGAADMESEIGRFPRLFRGRESIPGLTIPRLVFENRLTLRLGRRRVEIIHIGRAHTAGDTIVWLPEERVLFAGDTVEFGATPYCGDAHFTDWPATLERLAALKPEALLPGRGRAARGEAEVREALSGTLSFVTDLFALVKKGVARGAPLGEIYREAMETFRPRYGHWVIFEHCMPFNVSRAYDEANGVDWPRIWTAARDREMWAALTGAGG